ncbi:zinc finger RNA-binding protein isoform X2 [Planococcus citri]|uniref:zinc finger RNA-binding protein isoform X2 n=1 Tax=Planococcus citri TaxID=170843 RepID=UPI0031F89170
MAANNYFGYGGTQYAAANAAYQQTQQAYGVPAATGASSAASYSNQRTAYDAAYQTSATPVTYAAASATSAATYDYGYSARTAPAAVGVTYDSAKTYYQQAAPAAAAVAATTGQVAATVASTPEFQNWQQAGYNARPTSAATVAAVAAANKAAYSSTYSNVPTTRQLTVPPITPKGQSSTNSSPYATQYANQQPSPVAPSYYSTVAPAQSAAKAAAVGTIGQPPKKPNPPYQQKPGPQSNLGAISGSVVAQANPSVSAAYTAGSTGGINVHSQNPIAPPSVYNSVPASPYSNPTMGSAMYNSNPQVRPKTNPTSTTTNTAPNYSNPYDAALFNAAATMYMNQNPRAISKPGNNFKPRPGLGSNRKFPGYRPPKPQQLHYCDACKISCAGPSAYHDHLQGQKHKKKVAKSKPEQTKGKGTTGGSLPVFVCELCDIECTAADAYAAHLRGAKHTKVVKLHTRLGKPIPPPDPKAAAAIAALNAQEEAKVRTVPGGTVTPVTPAAANSISVRSSTTPRINFVAAGATPPATAVPPKVEEKIEDISTDEDKKENDVLIDDRPAVGSEYIEEEKDATGKLISFNCKLCECKFSDPNAKEMHMKGRKHRLQFKKKVDPKLKVEMKPNNFKHKRNEKWKKQTEKQKDGKRKDFRYDDELKDYLDWCRKSGPSAVGVPGLMPRDIRHPLMRNARNPLLLGPGVARLPAPAQPPQPPMFLLGAPPLSSLSRKLETFEDRHILARHKAIYPTEVELKFMQKVVGHVERALKLVSDHMLTEAESKVKKEDTDISDNKNGIANNDIENEHVDGVEDEGSQDESSREDGRAALRELTGVLRIGNLAKGLILTGDDIVDLVMLCSGKPTMSLLTKVVSLLPEQLKEVAKDTEYTVTSSPVHAAIVVSTCPKEENDKKLTVRVTLASPVIREEILAVNTVVKDEISNDNTESTNAANAAAATTETASTAVIGDGSKVSKEISPDPPDVLSKTKCLEALAALRHAKWFQARAATVQSCLIVIRILRDLCKRVPTWAPFESWALELLCEKVLSSSTAVLSPGDGLRRVFQAISSGLLLPGGPGLLDPCEKDPVDAAAYLTDQQREEITASAQHALRLIAFRQIHKVLGMEPLPPMPKFHKKQTNRKRRRENSAGGRNEGVEGKKDKKDAEDEPSTGAAETPASSTSEVEKMETDKPATTK